MKEINAVDLKVIIEFANGNNNLKELAITIHRKNIKEFGVRGTAAMRFMAEIDNPSPDLYLRSYYREVLLNEVIDRIDWKTKIEKFITNDWIRDFFI